MEIIWEWEAVLSPILCDLLSGSPNEGSWCLNGNTYLSRPPSIANSWHSQETRKTEGQARVFFLDWLIPSFIYLSS